MDFSWILDEFHKVALTIWMVLEYVLGFDKNPILDGYDIVMINPIGMVLLIWIFMDFRWIS